jgi:predicted nucleic acid-binding protein
LSVPTLIDTSAWIEALRRNGDAAIRAKVQQLLVDDAARLCDAVRLELWNGARGNEERKALQEVDAKVPRLEINNSVWNLACDFATKARNSGLTLPAIDILIFACARHHGVSLEHNDRHYDSLQALP